MGLVEYYILLSYMNNVYVATHTTQFLQQQQKMY